MKALLKQIHQFLPDLRLRLVEVVEPEELGALEALEALEYQIGLHLKTELGELHPVLEELQP